MSNYSVKSHVLLKDGKRVRLENTKKKSGKIKPKYLVIHYTAGSSFEGDIHSLAHSNAASSCHLVLDHDGTWCQISRLNDKLWHAGRSQWDGINGLNGHSIGIEVTNIGVLKPLGDGTYKTWTNKILRNGDNNCTIVEGRHPNGGPVMGWTLFTPEQMQALDEVVPTLMQHYGLREVVGHDMISPGRKSDPGLCMDRSLFDRWSGRATDGADDSSQTGGSFPYVVSRTGGTGLNIRRWPAGTSAPVSEPLKDGTRLSRIRTKDNWWLVVTEKGLEGWVYSTFVSRA